MDCLAGVKTVSTPHGGNAGKPTGRECFQLNRYIPKKLEILLDFCIVIVYTLDSSKAALLKINGFYEKGEYHGNYADYC